MPGNRSQVRSSGRALSPITGPWSGAYHSRGDAVPGKINFSATEGNYFGSKKELSAGSSSLVRERSREDFSNIIRGIGVIETIQIKEGMEDKPNAASNPEDVILPVDDVKRKSIRSKEKVHTEYPIGASAAATRSVKKFFTSHFIVVRNEGYSNIR